MKFQYVSVACYGFFYFILDFYFRVFVFLFSWWLAVHNHNQQSTV